MALPVIPKKTHYEAITDTIESIALEEIGIAHILNAEAEKLQAVACLINSGRITLEEAIKFQSSVERTIQTIIKMQILLEFKLDSTLEFKEKNVCNI